MKVEILKYEINIDAPTSTVWHTLVDAQMYKQWVKAFSPNSFFEGEWVQGNEIKFLDPGLGGTKAVLDIVVAHKRILARHISLIDQSGEETTSGDMADKWIGTTEDYKLSEEREKSKLSIEIKTHSDFVEMFNHSWPIALNSIKQLSE